MNYQELTKNDLIGIVSEYQILTRQLVMEAGQDNGFDYFQNGNMGSWYLNLQTGKMTGSLLKFRALGFSENEVYQGISTSNFLSRIHQDDIERIVDNLFALRNGATFEFAAEYRIQVGKNRCKRCIDRARITQFDDAGRPLLLSGSTREVTSGDEMAEACQDAKLNAPSSPFLDNLTKTKNHRSLIRELGNAVLNAEQRQSTFTAAFIDIDNFKAVNEMKGHLCGNKALIEIAALIRQGIGEDDIFGRYRADEFMIIFTKSNREQAMSLLEQIRADVESYNFSYNLKITISGGVNEYHGENLSEFLYAVEMNLSQAKNCGKNRIVS